MKSRKPVQSLLGNSKLPNNDIGQLRKRLNALRQKSAAANRREEIEILLDEARALLKSTFQTEFEDDARNLFRELRNRIEGTPTGLPPDTAGAPDSKETQLARQVQRERLRLESSGGLKDMELAVDGLYGVLRELGKGEGNAVLQADVLHALESAAALNASLRPKIKESLESPEVSKLSGVQTLLDQFQSLPQSLPQPISARGAPRAAQPDLDIAQRLSNARRLFYAGDYYEAIDALTEILQLDPENREARERLAQVEDNIRRGVVPDSRVPFEARAAFGRAQSLERAGRFEEAREAYTQSLGEARKGGALLQNWQPAVEALIRIDNAIIAGNVRQEADTLLQSDNWRGAIEKYEAVLKLLPDDGQARERLRLLRILQEQAEVVRAQLNQLTDDLAAASQRLIDLRRAIVGLRPEIPDSQRLNDLGAEVTASADTLKTRLVERAQQLVTQARYLSSIASSRRLMAEASRLLEQARELAPGDNQAFDLAESVAAELTRLEQAERDLNEARRLINLNTISSRMQARDLLRALQEYNQEPVYLQLVSGLQSQYLEEAKVALNRKQLRPAAELLTEATQDIFNVLGASEAAWRLEQELQAARREPWLRRLGWGGGIVIGVFALAGLGRWLGIPPFVTLTPTATPLPTATMVLTATPPPSATASATFTSTPSATASPSSTPTPAGTPTPLPRFGAVGANSTARLEPSSLAPWAFTLRAADPVQILDEAIDGQGKTWYKILYVRGGLQLTGWARAVDINLMPTLAPS